MDALLKFFPDTNEFVYFGPFGVPFQEAKKKGLKWNGSVWATKNPSIARAIEPGNPVLLGRLAASHATESGLVVPCPKERAPHPYQLAGVEYALSLGVSYNADEMGLGKSMTGVLLANYIKAQRGLVICPAHLRINWSREILLWSAPEPPTFLNITDLHKPFRSSNGPEWLILSYEEAIKFAAVLRWDRISTRAKHFDIIIVDEAHYIKEFTSARSVQILGTKQTRPILDTGRKTLFLSGTPLPNKAQEFWPILRSCAPHLISDCLHHDAFANMFGYLIESKFGAPKIIGSKNEKELYFRLRSGFMVRRLQDEVDIQLPKEIQNLIVFPADGGLKSIIEKESAFTAKEIIEHGIPDGSPLADIRKELGIAKIPLVLQDVRHLLDGGLKKVVVFAHHREVVKTLYERLQPYGAVMIIGGMSDKARQKAVDTFKESDNIRVVVGNETAAGTGTSFVSTNVVVTAEQSWVPGENDQVSKRVCRIGQIEPRTYTRHILVQGSLDALILSCAARKKSNTGKVLDGHRT